jgi:hypothetical protein
MATTKTRRELVNKAAALLLELPAGQAANPEDYSSIDGYVDAVLLSLSQRDIVDVADQSSIPAEWFVPLAVILADSSAIEFGLSGVKPTASNPNPVENAEMRLRQMTYSPPTGEPQQVDYF